jgi:hypothetical protein
MENNDTRGIISVLLIIIAPLLICYWFILSGSQDLPVKKVYRTNDASERFYVNNTASSLKQNETDHSFTDRISLCRLKSGRDNK